MKEIERKVINNNGFIEAVTEDVSGCQYAFYLKKNTVIEKVFYSDSSRCCFDHSFTEGVYTIVFFYKNNYDKVSYSLDFYIDNTKTLVDLKKETIIDSSGFKIDYYDIGSEKTFIVFNAARSRKNHTPFGLNYLIKNKFNVISCLQNDNQYQELSFEDFKKYVQPLVKEHQVYLYGSSLGGYCAIYYSGAVNGTVIAGAPRNSSHPLILERLKSKAYYDSHEFKHVGFDENPLTDRNIYVFYDPYVNTDHFFINHFLKTTFTNLKLFECDHAGHEVLMHLNETKQLHQIIMSITKNKDPKVIDIDSSYIYLGKSKYFLGKKDYKMSRIFSKKALDNNTLNTRLTEKANQVHRIASENLNLYQKTD